MTANLLSRLQGLTAPDREVDALICVALQYGGPNSEGATNVRRDSDWDEDDLIFEVNGEPSCTRIPELTASLDATVALCERVLPGWDGFAPINATGEAWVWPAGGMSRGHRANGPTPAIALLIAILTAKEARENG